MHPQHPPDNSERTAASRVPLPRRPAGQAGLRAAAALLVAALLAVGCEPHLTPPPPSPKPPGYRPAGSLPAEHRPGREQAPPATARLAPPPAAPAKEEESAPAGSPAAPPAPAAPKAGTPEATLDTARKEAAPAPPDLPTPGAPGTAVYDPQQPCFSDGQMQRAARVLFRDGPRRQPARWMHAINAAFHRLGIPCGEEDFLVLVLTTIQLESAVVVDPPLENRDLEALLDYRLERLRNDNALAGKLVDTAGIADALRTKLRRDTRRRIVRTEADLVRYVEGDLRRWLSGYLEQHYYVPKPLAGYAAERALQPPVRTLGPMQVNVGKAWRNARKRGERIGSLAEMRGLLLDPDTALERGILEGTYQLWRSYHFYRRRLAAEHAVRYATADYNAGEFSSRNAAFQERLVRLTGHELALDGDLLLYENGEPLTRVSNTESAVLTLGAGLMPATIRRDLLLEKQEGFSRTSTARRVCARYRHETGQACRLALVPVGAQNDAARVKLGRDYTPANYASAYVNRWKANRALYRRG